MTSAIAKIKKRDGSIVEFEPEKIEAALQKAFIEVKGSANDDVIHAITREVVAQLEKPFLGETPSVENVQDLVERELMRGGHFDVAKSYILYRYDHAQERAAKKREAQEKMEKGTLMVEKRDGSKVKFNPAKLKASLFRAAREYADQIDMDAIIDQVRLEVYDGIKTKDVGRALLMIVRAMTEQDTCYSHIASRLLLATLYKEVIGADKIDFAKLEEQYRQAFIENIKQGVAIERLDAKLLEFDLETLSKKLVIDRDDLFRYLGTQTLYDRYFVQNPETKQILETPQAFWMRVGMGLAINEPNKMERAAEFYDIISTHRFVPSTPTLFHSGTPHPQLSSCYLNTVEDSLENIFKVYADNAQLSKWSGGIGTDWTNIRSTGAFIKGTGVESQGVIPFLKIANDVTVAINRSGRRRGATCVYLETWHQDIEDFLELRKNTGDERRRTHDMDTANWIPDLFMKRVKEDGEWTLFSPSETPDLHHLFGRKFEERYAEYERLAKEGKMKTARFMKAADLWKKMLAMLFETGHPWITWKDPSNVRSPQDHAGVIHNSNLCTEITLNTSIDETAVCNLGWINYALHVKDGKWDEALVKETVMTGMRMLDNVIDINFYPTPEAKNSNMKHRPVGLGLGGFHDALYQLGINFDSEAAVEFADSSMEMISYYAILASSMLAKERGAYASYRGSKWDRGIFPIDTLDLLEKERGMKIDVPRTSRMDWTPVRQSVKQHGMRNSNCLAVAPTATTSNIVGAIPTIEPIYKNMYVKSNQGGDFIVVNEYLVEDLKKLSLWDYEMVGKIKFHDGSIQKINEIPVEIREKYKEVFEIDPRWLIKAAAHRGKWIDQSQSLNIFFMGSSGRAISEIYMYAWEMGLKTTYYLRTLAASQVEKSTVSTAQFGATHKRDLESRTAGVPAAAAPAMPAAAAPLAVASVSIPAPVEEKPASVYTGMAAPEGMAKLCRIDDPSCESCQ